MSTNNTSTLDTDSVARALRTLTEAGVSFTVVTACPDPHCTACRPAETPAAAA